MDTVARRRAAVVDVDCFRVGRSPQGALAQPEAIVSDGLLPRPSGVLRGGRASGGGCSVHLDVFRDPPGGRRYP